MASGREPIGELVMNELLGTPELVSKNPTVLSCGGMYIPHRDDACRVLYHIITTSRKDEPVKVVTGARPRNALHDILFKESLN